MGNSWNARPVQALGRSNQGNLSLLNPAPARLHDPKLAHQLCLGHGWITHRLSLISSAS